MRSLIGWSWLIGVGCGGGAADVTKTTPTRPPNPTHPTTTSTPPTDPTTTDPTTTWTGDRRWDCSGMDPADEGPLGGFVALTFDDGPDPSDTPDILDVLRDHGAPATFFVLGEQLSDPNTWTVAEEIVDDPLFDLANHSWSHMDLADASTATAEAEVDDTTALIETFGVSPAFFRFPYGDSTCATHDLVTDRGLSVAGWHIDTADWCYAAYGACPTDIYWRVPEEYEDDLIGLTMEQIRRFDGGVVLLHDIHAYTAGILDALLIAIESEGYAFVALNDASVFPNLVAGTPVDLPYLGEACDVLDDRCWQVEHGAWCETTEPGDATSTDGVCTLPCEGLCLDRDGAATTFCAELSTGAGQCIGRSDPINEWCAAVPGTVVQTLDRHVGSSGVSASTASVCAPLGW